MQPQTTIRPIRPRTGRSRERPHRQGPVQEGPPPAPFPGPGADPDGVRRCDRRRRAVPQAAPRERHRADYPGPGTGQVTITVRPGAGPRVRGHASSRTRRSSPTPTPSSRTFAASGGALSPGDFTMRAGNEELRCRGRAAQQGQGQGHVLRPQRRPADQRIPAGDFRGHRDPRRGAEGPQRSPAQFGVPAKAKNLEGFLAPGSTASRWAPPPRTSCRSSSRTTLDELKAQGVTDPAKQYDVVTVASIVQAEGGQAEYGDVAGAIYNRLKPNNTETNGLIQSDATVTYGLGIAASTSTRRRRPTSPTRTTPTPTPGPAGRAHRIAGQDGHRCRGQAQVQRLPVLGHHQPRHQGDEVLEDPGRTQRLRGAVQRLVCGQPGTLRMTLRAAVLGHPIGHSKSPALHRAAYAYLGVGHRATRPST